MDSASAAHRSAVPESLNELLLDRRVIPFIGAGFSMVAGFPGWLGLLKHVYTRVAPSEDFDAVLHSCSGDPLRVAEFLLVRSGGKIGPIRHSLTSILSTPVDFVSSAHIDLVNLRLPTIYTTNFDELVEEAYRRFRVPIETICNARDLAVASTKPSHLVKFHGDLRYDESLVLTETSFLSRLDFENPLDLRLRGDILGRSVLFVGYGFGDINVRAIWHKLAKLMQDVPLVDRPPSFIVRFAPDPVLEALDRSVGLTTITLDPNQEAKSSEDRQRLIERFMLDLTYATDDARAAQGSPGTLFASPYLVDMATDVVTSRSNLPNESDEKVMEAMAFRQLHEGIRGSMGRLMVALSERRPEGKIGEYGRAIALNYAMSYGDSFDAGRR